MEEHKNYERGEHLENITDASMKDDDYFNASRNIDRKYITIEGARENNLKNINVKIPRDKFVVVTGLSGSGKSSLAFDTIYAEGQRRTWSRCPPMRDSSLDRLRSRTWTR